MAARIYTRTGDTGDTGLFGGRRVPKDDPRVEAFGSVDELNAVLGVARSLDPQSEIGDVLVGIQAELFALGADLATPPDEETHHGRVSVERIGPERADRIEALIDRFDAELPPLNRFILPGGVPLAAALHAGRTVCRRAERRCVTLAQAERDGANSEVVRYLNRLADLLFVLARAANHRSGGQDVLWEP